MLHIFLHFLLPACIAWLFFRNHAMRAFLIMIATMVVDLDHLLAVPIYDPLRCSIGFHPLHSYYVLPLYVEMLFFPKTRIVGIGLVIHMVLDFIDCYI